MTYPHARMFMNRFKKQFAVLVVTLMLPVTSLAATVSDVLKVPDGDVVSRGDFLRASIVMLNLPIEKNAVLTGTYARPVPKAMRPYVRAAEKYDAIDVLGKDLSLSKGITRGEALMLVTQLQKLKPSGSEMKFADVKEGSDQQDAVRVAVEKQWMQPIRSNYFGVARSLTGREATLLLRKIAGEDGQPVEVGPDGGTRVPKTVIRFKKKETPPLPQDNLLRTIWQLLSEQYLYQDKVDEKEAAYSAAEALANSLGDPYTTFMRPANAKDFQDQLNGGVSGIGAQVEYRENKLFIVSPITGSPAEKAGLKSGDEIVKVDGENLAGLGFLDAVNKVRGPQGSKAKLTIKRDGVEFDVEVTRDQIRIPEIDISYQGSIAIVKLVQFGQTTDRELRSLLVDVQSNNPTGIVLDLRNNPGGLLHAAEIVVSNFLPQGTGVANISSNGSTFLEVTADPPTIDEDVPLVVLVNKGSASASEIVAGALQDAKRATVMGEKTFGKGTVQQIVDFYDGSSLKMTIAEWLTPNGRKINGAGLEPDIAVSASDVRDEQLLRAIDHLR